MLQAPRWLGHELPGCNALLTEEICAQDERRDVANYQPDLRAVTFIQPPEACAPPVLAGTQPGSSELDGASGQRGHCEHRAPAWAVVFLSANTSIFMPTPLPKEIGSRAAFTRLREF